MDSLNFFWVSETFFNRSFKKRISLKNNPGNLDPNINSDLNLHQKVSQMVTE